MGRQTFRVKEARLRKNKCSLVMFKDKEWGKLLSQLEHVLWFLSEKV